MNGSREETPAWVESQRKWLRSTVVGRLGIYPPWCAPVGNVPVSIDPGSTFGHGAHPSTALVLAEVDRLTGPTTSVLDVGCGSGVLGIAAARLGAQPVVSIDVEANAVERTRANAAANGVELSVSTTPIDNLAGSFDLVLANVLPVVHRAIAIAVSQHVASTLVVSGILDEQTEEVCTNYFATGLIEDRRTSVDGWTAIVLSRPHED